MKYQPTEKELANVAIYAKTRKLKKSLNIFIRNEAAARGSETLDKYLAWVCLIDPQFNKLMKKAIRLTKKEKGLACEFPGDSPAKLARWAVQDYAAQKWLVPYHQTWAIIDGIIDWVYYEG